MAKQENKYGPDTMHAPNMMQVRTSMYYAKPPLRPILFPRKVKVFFVLASLVVAVGLWIGTR